MHCVKKYYTGGELRLYEGKPRKKGGSQQERKDYAEMKAQKERERLLRKAERKGQRAERRDDEPIGYRETIQAGGPRRLESAVRGREPIYQDEYEMLQRAAMVDPDQFYNVVGLSGVRKGGEFADPCREGNKGAGAGIACDASKARQVARQRQGKKTTFMDVLMNRLRGRMMPSAMTEAQRNYSPYNEEQRQRIDREMGASIRGITLNNAKPSGFNINFR